MNGPRPEGHEPGQREAAAIEREREDVVAAILLVGSDRSLRITVANLRFGDALLSTLSGIAAARGVSLRPIWGAQDGGATDIVIEART